MSQTTIRIFIVDDHAIVRDGLSARIETQPKFLVCGSSGSLIVALEQIPALLPNLAIIDLSLPDGSGLELLRAIRERCPTVATLILSMHAQRRMIEQSLALGANGYILKEEASEQILTGIRRILAGECFLSPETIKVLRQVGDASPSSSKIEILDTLTEREQEILDLIAAGRTTAEISDTLHLSPRTVDTHKQNLRRKLNCTSMSELAVFAAKSAAKT